MALRTPNHAAITVGNEIPIVDRSGVVLGRARLIERRPSRYIQDGLPYIKHESPNGVQDETLYIWSYERWLVEWVSHPTRRPGERTCEEVNYYVRTTTDQDSYADVNLIGARGPENGGLFIFLEEEGVLTGPSFHYPDYARQALKRIKRAINGSIIMYGHNKAQVREHWELNKIKFRILDFLPTHLTFGDAVTEYLELNEWEDYVVVCGKSNVSGPNVIQCGPNGLKLKQ